MTDYLELNLYLDEDFDNPKVVDLCVYTDVNKFFVIHNVNADPVRYQGWWTIPYIMYNTYATAHVEADKVLYFTSIPKDSDEKTH